VSIVKVNVISNTVQEFNGVRYYLCGRYFQKKGRRLHVAVWEYHKGKVPKGYHVHHDTDDRSKNDIENLKLMKKGEHLRYHTTTPKHREYAKNHMLTVMIPLAAEWHKSEEGRAWHSAQGKRNAEIVKAKPPTIKICEECGHEYETHSPKVSKFCHPNCKAKALRKRRRNLENS